MTSTSSVLAKAGPGPHAWRRRLGPVFRVQLQTGCRSATLPAPITRGGVIVKKVLLALAALGVLASAGSASTSWSLVGTNVVASSPVAGGGYPVPPGSTK